MNKELDIAALESVSFAKNYNSYVYGLILQNIKSHEIMDFGAGYGSFSGYLKDIGKKVVTVEVNEHAIKKLNQLNLVNFKNLKDLPEKYGTIVSLNVLEHIDDDLGTLKELLNYLKSDGRIILYLPSSKLIWSELDELVNHKRRYSRKLIKELSRNSDLKIDKIFSVDFVGWLTVLVSKVLRINLDFNKNRIIFYDRFIFKNLKFLDLLFKKIIGKNLLIVLSKK